MDITRTFKVIFGIGFPAVGILLIAIGIAVYVSGERARSSGVIATGNVVGVEEWVDPEGSMYAPIVRFTTREGEVVEFTSKTRSRPAEYDPGDVVPVLYSPDAPKEAEIDSAFGRFGAPAILGGVGLVLAVVGAVVAFVVAKILRPGPPVMLDDVVFEADE